MSQLSSCGALANWHNFTLCQLLKLCWKREEIKIWRNNVLIKFLHHPNLAPSKYRSRYKFNKGQAFALIPDQRIERYISQVLILEELGLEAEVNISLVSENIPEGKTIRKIAQHIVQNNLSERNEHTKQRKNEELYYLDHFSFESVKKWLDLYVVFNTPDKQALADDILWVFRSLERNEERARELLTWIQEAVSSEQLKNPRKPGLTYLSSFLKKDEYISKPYEPLLPSSLRKLGAVFASVVHGPKNLSKANTYASEALRYNPNNHTSPSDKYTIVKGMIC
ncbi:hypothetical protein C1646_759376 [Rhizophagus diaphanus]|nr:hypothetical protein C1646_759376 [Rhizophagus diaphanus] [Rhizophagus sp. MUCL 43196]